jgi:hypothetical protein
MKDINYFSSKPPRLFLFKKDNLASSRRGEGIQVKEDQLLGLFRVYVEDQMGVVKPQG